MDETMEYADRCPICDEVVDIGDGYDGEEYECCGRVMVWTRFPGGYFALVEHGS